MSRIMKAANKPQYTAIVVLGFLCLGVYSYGQRDHGYDQADIDAVGKIIMGDAHYSGSNERESHVTPAKQVSPAKPVKLIFGSEEWAETTRYAFSEEP